MDVFGSRRGSGGNRPDNYPYLWIQASHGEIERRKKGWIALGVRLIQCRRPTANKTRSIEAHARRAVAGAIDGEAEGLNALSKLRRREAPEPLRE
jgi:hypothetical protein